MGRQQRRDGLTPGCAPRQGARRWSTFVVTTCMKEFPGRCACVKQGKDPSRQNGRRPTKGNQGSPPQCAREVGREGVQDTRKASAVRVDAAVGGAESRAVRDCHRRAQRKSPTPHREGECSLNCRPRTTRRVVNTCVDCFDAACTAHGRRAELGGRACIDGRQAPTDKRNRVPMRMTGSHQM